MSKKVEPEELTETVDTSVGALLPALGAAVPTADGALPPALAGLRHCLVEIHGDEVERRIELSGPSLTVGRIETNDVVIPNAAVSRQHARFEATETGYDVVDLASTNGTLVNDVRVQRCPLRHEDVVVIGSTAFRFIAAPDLDQAVAGVIARIGHTDGLTQVPNRSALEAHVAERARSGVDQCLILLEIEGFDGLTAHFHDLAMDRVVTLLASQLKQRVRRTDFLARVDRHRFAVVLETGDETLARRKAESLRRHVSLSTFRYHDAHIPVTLRTVVVVAPSTPGLIATRLIGRAAAELDAGP
ncbi:FHA domain-containing protein [Myxococcota bacterium]|nr:FHA domain-containing protein [Myxococcota bacterium]